MKDISTEEFTAKDFAEAYQTLCEKYGYRIVVSPAYIVRDDGTFSTVLQYNIGEMPKNKEEEKQ